MHNLLSIVYFVKKKNDFANTPSPLSCQRMYSLETTELKSNPIYTRIALFVSINIVQASVITECMPGIIIITDCNTNFIN